MKDRYPIEEHSVDDNGTMPENVDELREAVVGRKIIDAEECTREIPAYPGSKYTRRTSGLALTLDNGHEVFMADTDDCCAYTELEKFWRDPSSVDHAILGVGTTDGYTKWHIYADFGDVLTLDVGWSAGNPFYYGYGFDIIVQPATIPGEVVQREIG